MTPAQLERLVALVMDEHEKRLDVPDGDLKRKPFRPRPRPNTALISDAIARKAIRRELDRLRRPKTETVS